ncbi:MAG: choice-of-anchor L domain-containing protein [Saprospiraceae bacterium]
MKKTFTKNIFKVGFGILSLFWLNTINAQMTVTDPANPSSAYTPVSLISNVFISGGVQIDNIVYQGDLKQVGYYQNGGAIGLTDGIIISTGNAEEAPNIASGSTTGNPTGGPTSSTYLSGLIPGFTLNDIVQYEITFTPTTSNLSFQYVFASEEYETYAPPNNSSFNDVFGFFISGPNNAAPYSNIAFIPGTTTPVSINNINPVTNTSYYVSNVSGTSNVKYGGYTTVMTATTTVVPCQQYTIILTIADAGDSAFDSAIFLEGGTFTVDGIAATPVTPSPDTVLVEGCAAGSLDFSVDAPATSTIPITYSIGGTATMGIDYDTIPLSGLIPPGSSTFTIPIVPLNDGVADGQEYIEFIFNTNPCTVDTVRIYIKDNELTTNIDDAFICVGDSVTLDATSPVTIPPPYTFSKTDTLATIEFTQVQSNLNISGFPFPQVTAGMIESVCLDITHISPADLDIFLLAPDGSFLELSTDNGQIANNFGQACFTANPLDPTINGSNSPFLGNYQPEGFWSFLYGAPVNGTWQLLVTDDSPFLDGTINSWSINFASIYNVQYSWTPTTNINYIDSPVVVVNPPVTTDYIVSITDTYGCTVSDTATITVDNQIPAPIISCGNINNASIEFVWQPITNVTAYEVNINGTGWIPANGTLSHLVTGLPSLTAVTLEVRAISPPNSVCTLPPLIGTHSCTTTSCALTTTVLSQTDVTCFGGTDGSITIDVPAGVPPYSHTINGGTAQTSTTFTNLTVGTYNIVTTDSINCQTTLNVLINEPAEVTGTMVTTDVSCSGGNDGTATVTPSGGANTTYTYSWSTIPVQTTQTATGLSAGTYYVTLTDANMCTGEDTVIVIEPTPITLTMSNVNVSCNGANDGSVSVVAVGGTGNYTYNWNTTPAQTTQTATALSGGLYEVTVTDANMCTASDTVSTYEPPLITYTTASTNASCNGGNDGAITITNTTSGGVVVQYSIDGGINFQSSNTFSGLSAGTYIPVCSFLNGNCPITGDTIFITQPDSILLTTASTDITCNGANDGTATATASGGTGVLAYSWSTTPVQTTASISNLAAGTYYVTVTDDNSCTTVDSVTIAEPLAITYTTTPTNLSCNNDNLGSIVLTASGGTGILTYNWSNGDTTATISNLAAGTYIFTITDASNCFEVDSLTITEPTAITLSTTSTDATCNSSGDGTATVSASGGTPGYTYLWDANAANQITATATGLNQGTFTVNVTDANNCVETVTATVNVPSPIVLSMVSTDLSCFGASDGTATVTASGGAGNYTYAWNTTPMQTMQTATGLSAGTTIVTVTDANGCFDTAQAQITGQVVMTIGFTTTDANCNSGNDGTATVNVTNGNSPFNYTWNTGTPQTTQTATTLTTGTYTVTIVDNIGCVGIDSTTINEPTALTSTTSSTPLDCFGDGTGTATVTVGGGTSGYTYNWNTSPAQTTQTATGLQAGTYFVTSTDANMCTIIDTVIVIEPTPITLTMSNLNVSCNGANDGTVNVTAVGGTGTYTYNWNTTPAQITPTANGLNGGLYEVTVTDINMCTASDTVSTYEPPLITYTTASTNVSCFGGNDGTITITNTTTGGASVQYSIDGGTTFQVTNTFTGLVTGTYTPVCSFLNGNCPITETDIIITQPDSITLTTVSTDITCNSANDGTANATASGGTGVLTYAWSTTPVQTTASISSLAAGTYYVTVTDDNMCSTIDSVIIAEPSAITYTTTPTNLLCNNDNSGNIVLTASGGTGTLTYSWSNGETTSTISNLAAGTYIFTITDSSACFEVDSVTITEPTVLTSSTTSTDISCFGANDGTGTVTPAGGTMGYTYLWTNGMSGATATGLGAGVTYVTITDANMCTTVDSVTIVEPTQIITNVTGTDATCNGLTDGTAIIAVTGGVSGYTYTWDGIVATDTVSNLGAGWHYVLVTDATSCMALDSILTNEPAPIVLSTSMTSVSCSGGNDGTATVSATGGASGFSYQWNTSPAQFTATATNLTTGTYIVTVTDANGCFNVDSIAVTTPNPLTATLTGTNVDCFGATTGTITTAITGGVTPYNYAWNVGATTGNLINVPAGNYTVTITDGNNCFVIETIDITQPLAPIVITLDKTDVACNGGNDGTATAAVTGGTAPYTYSWNTTPQQVTPVATGLAVGTYTLTVTDANGCQQVASTSVQQPSSITAVITEQGASCFGGNDGTATVAASGGTPGYTYIWNTVPQQVGTTATNLTGGQSYTVTVTDSLGCMITQNITITQPAEIKLTTTQTNITCNGFTDGTATVLPTGGTPGYTYLWGGNANNQTTATANDLGLGSYSVTVTDANGCTATISITIIEPNPLFMDVGKTDVLCKGDATGTATATFSGGNEPYSPVWSYNNTATNNINNLPAGTYYLTLTDGNNCQLTDSVIVEEPLEELSLNAETVDNLCFGDRDGEISIDGVGGTYPYQFSLDGENYSNSNRFIGLEAGNYTIYNRDANGCLYNENITITEPDEFTIDAIEDLDMEFGDAAILDVTTTNGIAPITYIWTPAAFLSCSDCQSPVADSLSVDTYFEVFATDNNGCTAESAMFVRVSTPRYVFIANGFTPNDDGNNDVLYVQGGRGTSEVVSFQVFDRWGELVYEAMNAPINDETYGWDGTYKGQDMNGGVFVWAVEVLFEDGKTVTYKGSTILIR